MRAGGGALVGTASLTVDLLFGGSRAVHVAAVLGGCVLVSTPSAGRCSRACASHPARDGATVAR